MQDYTTDKEIVIPKGTKFSNISGMKTEYGGGNYQTILEAGNDAVIYVTISDDTIKHFGV